LDDPRLHEDPLDASPLLLLLDGASGPGIEESPFFREAIAVVLDHPIVHGLPLDGYAGIHWKGVAPDRALQGRLWGPAGPRSRDTQAGSPGASPEEPQRKALEPVISRFDARTFRTTHYLLAGETDGRRTVATTLRLAGGSGRQPAGPAANVLGRTLLARCVAYLEGSEP